jgi:transposase
MKFQALPGWKITGGSETSTEIFLSAELTTKPPQCCYCHASLEALRPRGTRLRKVKDIPVRGKTVEVLLMRRLYLCTVCGRTLFQPLTGVDGRRGSTARLIEISAHRAFRRPVWLVALETGLSESLVRTASSEEAERLGRTMSCDAPRVLGVEVVFVGGRERLLLTDVEVNRVLHLAESANQSTAERTLSTLRDHWRVEVVVLPISRPLRDAARRVIPQAKVIVDRFLVMSLGKYAVDAVREHLRCCSPERFDDHHELTSAYALRARFNDVWRSTSGRMARRRYAAWAASVPAELSYAFGPLLRMVETWSDEIFDHFDYCINGTYPEVRRRGIRSAKRGGHRHDFQTIRAKIIYGPPFR